MMLRYHFDGYLAEVNLIDGTAFDTRQLWRD